MFKARMKRLTVRMAETKTDGVFVGPTSNMKWLAGFDPHGDERPVMLVVGPKSAAFLMPALNADSARQHTDLPFETWSDAEGAASAFARVLSKTGISGVANPSIALDETMRADFALMIVDALPGAKRQFLVDTVGALRAAKDESEYKLLKMNALIDDETMCTAFAALKPGMSELEAAGIIEQTFKANGASVEFVIVCFGENGAYPHHHSGERRLKEGDAILIDIGGRKDGYPSDMTRVGYCGAPPKGFEEVTAVVELAVQAAIAAARPGVKASDVDRAARETIAAAGFGDCFLHRTGHGLGIDTHERPYITATSDVLLQTGNVFSIEPGIYLTDRFGVRLEEIVLLRETGAEVLSELSRKPVRVSI
ncbi:peptidase M24 [Dickeya dadantii]|uniref:M24 family metallopeptidase n=1 Tax=Dickeya dadantii TaxID=204038 RepID=UPI000980D1D1|nr:Xaa-Pro peptidase family protein [Dickeya dadantii]OOC14049.1 peptidase M24 [Dickeya dadantii]